MKSMYLIILFFALAMLGGCATNPVTGENELAMVSTTSELKIGQEQYVPSRQMQGGDYVLDPALTDYVQGVGARLARVSDRRLPYEFAIINDSTPNAWALPGGKIAVNRGLLLELGSEAELAAVLGHEVVHAAARHSAQGMEREMMLKGALVVAGAMAQNTDYGGLAVGAAALGANLVNQRYSRDAELESDYYGMRYMQQAGYDPQAAVDLQETFVKLSKGRKTNWLNGLFASHPPSPERVQKNKETLGLMGEPTGRLGVQEYRRMTAGLRKSKPAYGAYDKGRQLVIKQPEKALRLAERAIDIEPREAMFYGLRGDALAKQGKLKQAHAAYDQALARDDGFFAYHLQRGLIRRELGDSSGAGTDLQNSVKLLPTAQAHYGLGLIALDRGDRRFALKHFQVAAGSDSKAGRAAANQMMRMELSGNPERYLKTRVGRDSQGRLMVQVSNGTRATIGNLVVLYGRRDASGRIYRGSSYRLDRVLGPGQSTRFVTPISGLPNSRALSQFGARVIKAEVMGN
ncbi:MAG: M48 family metalloprotease [Gammaproteobacteria bacterium]|nr:M48 family metalloprotease [Gammaproteobacteria bacterium]